jgi:predicted DNA-binding transcriptional regulator AlpA
MSTNQENKKLRTLAEAAEYLGLSEPTFRHMFYNVHDRQHPRPKYIGKRSEVKKNMNGVEREIKFTRGLHFTQQSLDEFLNV